jgi:hypothetical protein
MDRLTARSPKNNLAYLVKVKSNEQAVDGSYNTLMCIRESFEYLAAYEDTGLTPEQVVAQKAENTRLRAENDDLFYKLVGVMHSVDKWLDGDELKQDEVNRAATMREKTLKIVEQAQKELEQVRAERDAAAKDLRINWLCRTCNKRKVGHEWAYCKHFILENGPEETLTCGNFEWRGPQKEGR